MKPSALVKYDGVAWRGDVSCRLVYTHEKKMLYGGVSYSPTNSVTGLIGGSFHGVVLGYSYEFYTSAISPGNGSHELFVGYQTDINLVKKEETSTKRKNIISKHEYEEMYIIPLFGSSSLGINWMLWSQVSLGLR